MLRPGYPLQTPRLLLRPYRVDDLDALWDIQSRPEVARFLYWEPRTRTEVKEALATRMANAVLRIGGESVVLAVERRDTGALIGDVNLMIVSREHWRGEIGFVFHPEHQGQGFAVEAAGEVLRLGFETTRLHRIIGRCDVRNRASARVMERLGMRLEGHFLESELVKGEWCDEYVYALLESEWRNR